MAGTFPDLVLEAENWRWDPSVAGKEFLPRVPGYQYYNRIPTADHPKIPPGVTSQRVFCVQATGVLSAVNTVSRLYPVWVAIDHSPYHAAQGLT
eukprot:3315376-Rhodomonas_salina.3